MDLLVGTVVLNRPLSYVPCLMGQREPSRILILKKDLCYEEENEEANAIVYQIRNT